MQGNCSGAFVDFLFPLRPVTRFVTMQLHDPDAPDAWHVAPKPKVLNPSSCDLLLSDILRQSATGLLDARDAHRTTPGPTRRRRFKSRILRDLEFRVLFRFYEGWIRVTSAAWPSGLRAFESGEVSSSTWRRLPRRP